MNATGELQAYVDRPTAVYRFYDALDQLLYVGITCNLPSRFRDHQQSSPWWIAQRSVRVIWRDNRADAADEERQAIRSEQPIHNVQGTRLPVTRARHTKPDPAIRQDIATEVRGEVARAGVSKSEVRSILGLSRQSMWQRMRGEISFTDEELSALADYIGIPVARFFPASAVAS